MRPEATVPAIQRRFARLLIAVLAQLALGLAASGPVRAAPLPVPDARGDREQDDPAQDPAAEILVSRRLLAFFGVHETHFS